LLSEPLVARLRAPQDSLEVSWRQRRRPRRCATMWPMVHPLPWQRSVDPSSLQSLSMVGRGARAAGSVADALVVHDAAEQLRRKEFALGAVTSLALLDAMLNLPVGVPVHRDDLAPRVREVVQRAPVGAVVWEGVWVHRLLVPPLTVVAALVRADPWRRALRRVGRFTPFAQRVILVDRVPAPELIWEANVAGVGVWVVAAGKTRELCAPELFVRRYWKAAGWRFAENAYAARLTSTPRPDLPRGTEGRPAHTIVEACHRR
jgi:hypothetical protein